MKLKYKFPDNFALPSRFANALVANAHRLTDEILQRCEAITRQKNEPWRQRWEERFRTRYTFQPSSAHLLAAIREAKGGANTAA